MLDAQLVIEIVLHLGQARVGLAGDCDGLGLVSGGLDLDEVFEGVVVDII